MKVVSKQRNSRMCFICGMDNPMGMKAQFYNMEDGSVMTLFRYKEEHQSFPQRVHGGLAATMLDELGFRALWAQQGEGTFGVTMSMEVKYRKPVPYQEELVGRGIVIKDTPKFSVMKSEIYSRNGILLVNADVTYIKLDVDKIAKGVDAHEEMCYLIEDDVREIPL
ncbi:MAG: PaaI family thioesterase [Lachnospiraceae bacterium]|nr:PaaI family thioesterase [Lachnospiraceae bacterium]